MTGTAAKKQLENPGLENSRALQADDEQLIKLCLQGNQEAWAALIDKYKNLIYSIPIKYGMYQDAGDIFQAVCVDLLLELPKIREYRALPKWLMQTCYHKCLHYQKSAQRQVELGPAEAEQQPDKNAISEQMIAELEKEQTLRTTLASLPARCRQMIHMLFYEVPVRSYEEVAKTLNLATGSIGFIRGRCLNKLKKQLEKSGF
jgi:RNA polymerase sigma factor (sigma-70 family)